MYRRSGLKGSDPQEFFEAIPVTRNPLYEENGGEWDPAPARFEQ